MSSSESRARQPREEDGPPTRYETDGVAHTQSPSPAVAPGPVYPYPGRPGDTSAARDPQRYLQARKSREAALVLGILGIIVLPVFAPFAVWQANKAERLGEIGTAGKILGWVGVVILILAVLGFILFAVFFGAVMSTFPDSPSYSA